jgi:hypothetical protein
VEVGSVPTSEEEANLLTKALGLSKDLKPGESLVGVTSLSQLKIEPLQHLGTNLYRNFINS